MSGIAGMVRWDNQSIPAGLLSQMSEKMAHRGTDGIQFLDQPSAGFVYLHLNVTFESFNEAQPLTNDAGITLVADARIDNRKELIEALGLAEKDGIPDSELVLAAYQKWSTDCVQHLIGDFAFVVWDSGTQTLFCARDHSGIRPLFYHFVPGKYFLFASEIKALWAFGNLDKAPDEQRIATYLCHWGQFPIYQRNTFFKDVLSLPPAHSLRVDKKDVEEKMYWEINPSKYAFQTSEEYLTAFREIFLEAVHCRIRTPFQVSSFLSGGLDSSSVAAVAATKLHAEGRILDTYYLDTELEETSEKEFVASFLELHSVEHAEIKADKSFYDDLAAIARLTDMPEMFSITYSHFKPLLKEVNSVKSRVLLTGSDGDTVVGYGMECIDEAIQKKDWKTAAQLLSKSHNKQDYQEKFGKVKGEKKYQKGTLGVVWRKLRKNHNVPVSLVLLVKVLLLEFNFSPLVISRLLAENALQKKDQSGENQEFMLKKSLWSKCLPFMKEATESNPTTKLLIKKGMLYQMMSEIEEQYDVLGAAYQIQMCHPFFDKRLIELCLFIPTELKFYEGFGRGPLRFAMKEFLPKKILFRKSKIDFSPSVNHKLVQQSIKTEAVLRENLHELHEIIELNNQKSSSQKPITIYPRYYHRLLHFLFWKKAVFSTQKVEKVMM
ncbi:asparagine synthase-related protein [Arundinibacter roseus]|uniref:asparagine synthase (glutamine-hydrolyzing) n=1 Tax=Arundinibacter roseus TaxID=2070510 RepID=A0A4R4K8V9_9BACT|nr:asparagine synthase-related protein [Arundinibacter roseus]TDB64050.1 asparagine synthetase B [Arundinibacter roseus]